MDKFIGIDIGGTNTRVALGDKKGNIVKFFQFETSKDPKEFLKILNKNIVQLIGKSKGKIKIGVGIPGLVDREKNIIRHCPNLPKWNNFSLGKDFKKQHKANIFMENDADLAALAEAKLGVGKGKKSVLYVGLGTGIGVGVVSEGKIYHGFYGTEGGHVVIKSGGKKCGCGNYGCWEAYNSGKAILERLKRAKDEKNFWQEISKELALGLSILSVCFVPEIIVLGGGATEQADKFLTQTQKELQKIIKVILCPQIKASKFKNISPGLIGALILASQK